VAQPDRRREEIVRKRRERIAKLIAEARKRLAALNEQISTAEARRKKLERQLTEARKHPRRNQSQIKLLRAQVDGLRDHVRSRGRMRDSLRERILPGPGKQREKLNTARGDLLDNLQTVQGIGSPMEVLRTLPTVGVLGGQILQVQTTLRDLQAPRETVTDTAREPWEREGILEQLLREANLRTAVSQAQYNVFRDMPSFGGGGVVPGPAGAPRVMRHMAVRACSRRSRWPRSARGRSTCICTSSRH
jgi:hypothetical protein